MAHLPEQLFLSDKAMMLVVVGLRGKKSAWSLWVKRIFYVLVLSEVSYSQLAVPPRLLPLASPSLV